MSYLARIADELAVLDANDLRRTVRHAMPAGAIDFSSNDYLGLRDDPRVVAALRRSDVAGSGGSRLLGGVAPAYAELEDELARWTGRDRALLFSSGYLAVMGAVTTLGRFVDAAYSDELVHACAIDALRLTKLPREIVPHATVARRPPGGGLAMFVTESVFGMDATVAPLAPQLDAMHAGDLLIVDEAHALGIAGPRGAGLAADLADERVVVVGTLSKALGVAGGFVAGPAAAIELLATAARTFVFDTAPPVALANAVRASLAIVRSSEGDGLRERLARNVARLRAALVETGIDTGSGEGAVVSVIVGTAASALAAARDLETRGIFAPAIRPPTVPRGTSRIRLTVRADHTDDELDAAAAAVRGAVLAHR